MHSTAVRPNRQDACLQCIKIFILRCCARPSVLASLLAKSDDEAQETFHQLIDPFLRDPRAWVRLNDSIHIQHHLK